MPRENQVTLAFNRGVLSQLGLARIDLSRYRMAAATMVNWIARVLGSMMLRPGTAFIGATAGNAICKTIPFIFGATDTARIEVTQGNLQVWVNDALISRPAVTTTVTNGNFATNTAGWTNASETGASVTWQAAGQVAFVGTGSNNAILDQQVNVGNVGVRHALRIVVMRGPFTFLCGTSQGDDSYVNQTILNTGTHSLAFTPTTSTFWIRFENSNVCASLLGTVNIEGAGILSLPAPWQLADFPSLRWVQSADIVYVSCAGGTNGSGYPQMQLERRATDSWSIVNYLSNFGPFRSLNITNITLTPSAVQGDITLTASRQFFKVGHVGALFAIASIGQLIQSTVAAANQFSNPVLITGTGTSQRQFQIVITGTWVGTLTLQYAFSAAGPWIDTTQTYTGNVNTNYFDNANNQSIYYRIGFDTGNYTSGSAGITLSISSGSITGVCRVTAFQTSVLVNAQVLVALGNTAATVNWFEGAWSAFRGYPGTVQLFQGRLWWFGTSLFGSASDDFTNFDTVTQLALTGDAAPIIGQLDQGAIDNIYWAIGLQQLVLGTASTETSCRSDYLGEPITPTNFNVLTGSTQGSANVNAIQMDRSGIFVQITGSRVFSLDLDIYTYSYRSTELTLLVPDLNEAGIEQLVIQNKPDRRLHCRRADGSVGIMVWDAAENVMCWQEFFSAESGQVIDISILPGVGLPEDQVYYTIQRVVNGQFVIYHEKWALERDCTGLPVAKCADSHVIYSGVATSTLTAIAPHLAGQTVCVWGWNTITPYVDGNGNQPGLNLGDYPVASDGSINGLQFGGSSYQVTNAVVGLPYVAQWQSMKQAFAAALGTPLNQPGRINQLGLLLQNTHAQGIVMGTDFEHLDSIPQADLPTLFSGQGVDGTMPDLNAILTEYESRMSGANDIWATDKRVCLQAASPNPCTVLAFTVGMSNSG
jgi:hypothetical protein